MTDFSKLQLTLAVTTATDRLREHLERFQLIVCGIANGLDENVIKDKFTAASNRILSVMAHLDDDSLQDAASILVQSINSLDEYFLDHPRAVAAGIRSDVQKLMLTVGALTDVSDVQEIQQQLSDGIAKIKTMLPPGSQFPSTTKTTKSKIRIC